MFKNFGEIRTFKTAVEEEGKKRNEVKRKIFKNSVINRIPSRTFLEFEFLNAINENRWQHVIRYLLCF